VRTVSAGELVITFIQMYEANYPEILKMCFIINGKFDNRNALARFYLDVVTCNEIDVDTI